MKEEIGHVLQVKLGARGGSYRVALQRKGRSKRTAHQNTKGAGLSCLRNSEEDHKPENGWVSQALASTLVRWELWKDFE